MKILGASQYIHAELGITPELLVRYALSQDITVAIVGCSTAREIRTLAQVARDFKPLSEREKSLLIQAFEPYARNLAFYREVAS